MLGETISSSPPVWWQVTADVAIAVGTIAVAILAIWGPWFRQNLAGSRLTIHPHNLRGAIVPMESGQKSIYYHIVVRNRHKWKRQENCRVLLRAVERKGPDGRFHPVRLSVPLQFIWAPYPFAPIRTTIVDEHILDLGYVAQYANKFVPTLYARTLDFDGDVRSSESVRYHLQAVSDDFASDQWAIFEVSWNGRWSEDLDEMEQHMRIRQIK